MAVRRSPAPLRRGRSQTTGRTMMLRSADLGSTARLRRVLPPKGDEMSHGRKRGFQSPLRAGCRTATVQDLAASADFRDEVPPTPLELRKGIQFDPLHPVQAYRILYSQHAGIARKQTPPCTNLLACNCMSTLQPARPGAFLAADVRVEAVKPHCQTASPSPLSTLFWAAPALNHGILTRYPS